MLFLSFTLALLPQVEQPTVGGPFALDTPLLPSFVVEGEPLPPAETRSIRGAMDAAGVPGVSVAVMRDGEVLWAVGLGVADVRTGRAVTPTTRFQAASISKPLAATGALRLAQEGRLDLDADVNDALEGWSVPAHEWSEGDAPRAVTVRDLLSHTAGTTVSGFPGYPLGSEIPSTIDVLDGRGNTPAVTVFREPGTGRQYSGGGYTIVQLLVDELAGPRTTYAQWMQREVLTPLGMRDSTFEQPASEELVAVAHDAGGRALECGWHVYPELAAAGLWTTPSDLLRFAASIQTGLSGKDGPVLTADMVRQMTTPPVEPGYGLGLSLGSERFGHGGGNQGFKCSLSAFRSRSDGVVVMTNGDAGWALGSRIVATVFDQQGWTGLEPEVKAVVALEPAELAACAGTYRFGELDTLVVEVAASGDRLDYRLESGGAASLRPLSSAVFIDTDDGSEIEFLFGEDGATVTGARWGDYEATRDR